MGEEKGLTYIRELAKQTELRTGSNLLAQLVAAGEFKGALSGYSQTFEALKPMGSSVDWVYLNPVFANIHPTGIAAKAPHPNAARLFIDFVLSKRGQEVIRGMNAFRTGSTHRRIKPGSSRTSSPPSLQRKSWTISSAMPNCSTRSSAGDKRVKRCQTLSPLSDASCSWSLYRRLVALAW